MRKLFYFLGLITLCATTRAHAAWPEHPVKLIVPYAPGGTTDIIARVIAQHFPDVLGQTLIVENKPGAGGTIGATFVANSAPDGYTLVFGTPVTHATAKSFYPKLGYDPEKSFTPVFLIGSVPNVVLVNRKLGVNSVAELTALAKSRPDTINYGSAGYGSTTHLSGELFQHLSGAHIRHVPYRGSGPALTDLQGGQIQLMFENAPTALPLANSEFVKAIAVTAPQRIKAAPELPTVAEAGVPGYEVVAWYGLFGPASMDPAVAARLNTAFNKIMAMPDVARRMDELGLITAGGAASDLGTLVHKEVIRWNDVIKAAGLKPLD
ncbi:hypothetical protein CAL29_25305 [Bordetella genomosp. 10]|uniref:ABC transporter substrate-binding protein n=1 Tax=Bordetella genomosp. 10 TaxID=1416804 RepID=A0A261S2P1_9BORD|nr:tripartite tricarboxylate transporter substrate binding protein [Bordetella genomosp. 10]OZI31247.1 hypothetical protein CAL29_25305 [Bordetella genomosp. 10]